MASSGGQFFSARLLGSGQVSFEVDDNTGGNYTGAASSATVNDGAWHHIAYVRQGATITIYVDGVKQADDFGLNSNGYLLVDADDHTQHTVLSGGVRDEH